MCPKTAAMTIPRVAMAVQASGMWKLPPDSAAWRAERPIIQAPLARATATDHSTAFRKRPSTSRISCSRWGGSRSEEHTSELQSLMRTSYAVFCLKKTHEKYRKQVNTQTETTDPDTY